MGFVNFAICDRVISGAVTAAYFVTPTNYRDCAALSLAVTTVIFSSFAALPAGIGYLGYRWMVTRQLASDEEIEFQEIQSNAASPSITIEAEIESQCASINEKCEVVLDPSETNVSGCVSVIPKQLARNPWLTKISLYLLDVKYHASDREYYSVEGAMLHRYGLTKVIKFLEIGSDTQRCLAYVSSRVGIPFRSLNLAEILSHGYTFTNDPQEGDLVLYSYRGQIRDAIPHIGLVSKIIDKEIWVESKWGSGSVYRHLEEAVPIDYGDEVCYLRKTPSQSIANPYNSPVRS